MEIIAYNDDDVEHQLQYKAINLPCIFAATRCVGKNEQLQYSIKESFVLSDCSSIIVSHLWKFLARTKCKRKDNNFL